MKKLSLLVCVLISNFLDAQPVASVKEIMQTFKTYPFGDPNPIPSKSLIYPYYRFDGFTNKAINKEWKVIELENSFIKLIVLPEVGGKIWAAWEKSTGLPFLYNNEVVKFRDVAMRGPWTSGGIEANYGIIGHTPNCATPVDYKTEKKKDGSVSCYIGTFDKLTRTYWTIEINLPADKAFFTTRSTWHNGNALEQPYYNWMNVGMPAKGNLEFIYPGTRYIGHEGEFANWKINLENKKDISFYEQNNFGTYKSYHVFGSYTDFFGAFYHKLNFGMGRYSLYDERPGKKIWIWGLSRQGMIWENLLSDTNGQYVEIQSGRLFNQSAEGSMLTPFKNRGFAPYSTDEWTEYWFPAKGTKGMVKANSYGSLNIKADGKYLTWSFSPLQKFEEMVVIEQEEKPLYSGKISFEVLKLYKDSIAWNGNIKAITLSIGNNFFYDGDATKESLSRPVQLPQEFKWDTPQALYMLGKEAAQGRDYEKAQLNFSECLEKDPYYLPALSELSFLQLRKLNYEAAKAAALKALSIDTYEPAANFAFGLASMALGNIADAKDAFGIASASMEFRSAAYTELSILYLKQNRKNESLAYAQKAIQASPQNISALQLNAILHRLKYDVEGSQQVLDKILAINPLSHFVAAEKFLSNQSNSFGQNIYQEMKDEVFIDLADWYQNINQNAGALYILKQAPQQAEILFWQAYLMNKQGDTTWKATLSLAENSAPTLIFPYRPTAAAIMEWSIQNSSSWKPKYFLGLIQWNVGNTTLAKDLFKQCGNPEFAPFHAANGALTKADVEQSLNRAMELDKNEWRYGKLLTQYFLERGDNAKALATIQEYRVRFPDNDAIASLTAKCLLLNNQYENSYKFLMSKPFLPNEGSTEGHQLYREALLMMALKNMENKKFSQALVNIAKAREWPESLGVGKLYDEDIDYRVEDFLQALCLNQSKKSEALTIFKQLTQKKTEIKNGYLLINAWALKKSGAADKGLQLLTDWKSSETNQSMPDWCLALFNANGAIPEAVKSNDQTRLLTRIAQYVNTQPF